MTKTLSLLIAACFAVSLAAPAMAAGSKAAPAPKAASAKAAKSKPLSETDQLNEQSLQAARAGQSAAPTAK